MDTFSSESSEKSLAEQIQTLREQIGEERYTRVEDLAHTMFRIARQEAGDTSFGSVVEEEEEAEADDHTIDQAATLLAQQLEEEYLANKEA